MLVRCVRAARAQAPKWGRLVARGQPPPRSRASLFRAPKAVIRTYKAHLEPLSGFCRAEFIRPRRHLGHHVTPRRAPAATARHRPNATDPGRAARDQAPPASAASFPVNDRAALRSARRVRPKDRAFPAAVY